MREVIVMTTHNDLAVAFEEQRKRREAHAAAWARNFDRHTRRFERHAPPGPNRIARRAHLQPDAAPAEPFSSEKQRSMMARLTDFFLPRHKDMAPKPKPMYSQRVAETKQVLLREVRNVDRRLLSEIRRAKRHQTPPGEPT
jgi:hypothetical protein